MNPAVIATLEHREGRWVFRHLNGTVSNQFEVGRTREAAVKILRENGLTVKQSGMIVSLTGVATDAVTGRRLRPAGS